METRAGSDRHVRTHQSFFLQPHFHTPHPDRPGVGHRSPANPPPSMDDFQRVQATRAVRSDAVADYPLRGLIICAACGYKMEGCTNNNLRYHRCRHSEEHDTAGVTRTVYVREDLIAAHLEQLITAALLGPEASLDDAALAVPADLSGQAQLLAELGLAITWKSNTRTPAVDSTYGTVEIEARTPKKNDYKIGKIL